MNHRPASTTYMIWEPFEQALPLLKEALLKDGLTISAELDISERIQQELGVRFDPCKVLYVDHPVLLLEAIEQDVSAAAFIPFHVVVCGSGHYTQVHTSKPTRDHDTADLPLRVRVPVDKLRARISRAIETVAMREGSHAAASPRIRTAAARPASGEERAAVRES
jgi:uncharacterized protein (DUF302 family)